MYLHLVRLQVHLGSEHHELLLKTFLLHARKVILPEMLFQTRVIEEIRWLLRGILSIANMTSFVFIPTVDKEFIIAVESLSTEATFRMSFESGLITSTRFVVAELLVQAKGSVGEELVLVGKNPLIPSAEVAEMSALAAIG